MKRLLAITVFLLVVLAAVRAQCPDFTDLNGPGVTCQYGIYAIPMMNTGIVPGRHTVITQQGMDPNTGYQLPMLPPGESAVVKLGNDLGGSQGEGIDYQFVVDPDHPILRIKYAAVVKNSGILSPGVPMFSIYLLDNSGYGGVSIYPCGHYYFTTLGWVDGSNVSGPVTWYPWSDLVIDLSQYVGQQIKVRFITYDANYANAFGYAYFTASCMSNRLVVVDCDGQNVTLAAPEGYAHYQWSNGSTSSTSTYSLQENLNILCHVTSSPGMNGENCDYMYDYQSIEALNLTAGSTWYDTICQDDGYNAHGFQLPPQEVSGDYTFTNLSLNAADCFSGTLNTLHLTVQPHNIHYYEVACEGTDYDNYGFHYTNLQVGSFVDSLPNDTVYGCSPAYKILHLIVTPSLAVSSELFGDNYICDGQLNTYMLNHSGAVTHYEWHVPDGVTNYSSSYGQSVNLYFTQDAPNPTVISVTAVDACGTHTLEKTVWHTPAYYLSYDDTICTGNIYSGHGIQTPLLDSAGLYYLSQHHTTVNGCDSDVNVRLWVGVTPELTALAQPDAICEGDETTIHAFGENAGFEIIPATEPEVKVGDILCTDSTFVKPENWPNGKIAKGVVFYVDSTGQHGWAVSLGNLSEGSWFGSYYWCHNSVLIGTAYSTLREALHDTNGLVTTHLLNQYNSQYQNDHSIKLSEPDIAAGWYVPTLRQLYIMNYEKGFVNASLQLVGTTLYSGASPELSSQYYWSSTEASAQMTWCLRYVGTPSMENKQWGKFRVRLVCDF